MLGELSVTLEGDAMEFLVEDRLDAEIKRIAAEGQARCAVAFWGRGAVREFKHPKGLRIVCNLASGATNPAVIHELQRRGASLRQYDTLHAKVYLGQTSAVVTSANVSANGLALEGSEQAKWEEAGALLRATRPIEVWFENIWKRSRAVTRGDLESARKLWMARRHAKPTLISFADFDPDAESLPLVTWWESGPPYRLDKEGLKKQFGYIDDILEARFTNGYRIEGPADRDAVKDGTWILWWLKPGRGVGKSVQAEWRFVGPTIATKAGSFESDEKFDVALEAEHPGRPPFDAKEARFRRALAEVLKRTKYRELTSGGDKGGWFTRSRRSQVRSLWRDVRERYQQATRT
jgi:hypothetical protein